jgi:hypothetical protein
MAGEPSGGTTFPWAPCTTPTRFTPYGPLCSGREGRAYLALRTTTDVGISYMPDERDELADSLDRHGIADSARRNVTLDLSSTDGELVADDDELRVAVTTVAATDGVSLGPAGGADAFAVVLSGARQHGERRHSSGALTRRPAGESILAMAAESGASIAWLQRPRPGPN